MVHRCDGIGIAWRHSAASPRSRSAAPLLEDARPLFARSSAWWAASPPWRSPITSGSSWEWTRWSSGWRSGNGGSDRRRRAIAERTGKRIRSDAAPGGSGVDRLRGDRGRPGIHHGSATVTARASFATAFRWRALLTGSIITDLIYNNIPRVIDTSRYRVRKDRFRRNRADPNLAAQGRLRSSRTDDVKVLSRSVLEFDGAVSGRKRIRGQAARSNGLWLSFWFMVCHPSTLRIVI